MIKGGYILQPRKIDESDISKSPPHIREIWLYLLRKATHKDRKNFKRGQLLVTYKDIIQGLEWYVGYRKMTYKKHHCEIAMKVLVKKNMITTRKTTRGIIITICNFDYYQNPENYESYTKLPKKATRKLQSNDTINKNDKNDKNDKKEYTSFFSDNNLIELFDDFEEMRKKNKKIMTERARLMAMKKTEKLAEGNVYNAQKILENAIMNSWQGVYPLKPDEMQSSLDKIKVNYEGKIIEIEKKVYDANPHKFGRIV
jgi:hypothetical protein